MKTETPTTTKEMGLSVWQATMAFGKPAVEAVLSGSELPQAYPDLHLELSRAHGQTRARVMLPGAVAIQIARRPECALDFYIDRGGKLLFASERGKGLIRPFDTTGARKISTEQALREFGPIAVYRAAEVGTGYKGER